ncbi:MAG TPA: hypothetical protein VLZ06_10860 [Solirubrobacteraceae bacterium]|nr:hypothetical protein [Solirubrobacteraceae bacterium]
MSAATPAAPSTPRVGPAPRLLDLGLAVFAVLYLAEALFMVVAPHSFYRSIGGFDAYNPHYLRDVATFSAALGAGLAVSLARPSWRVPMLAVSAIQYALHSINHLADIDIAHPRWSGYFDFFSLAAATLALAWLLRTAIACERGPTLAPHRKEISR